MNGPQHYAAGEQLIARLDVYDWTDPSQLAIATGQIAQAQAHFAAALVAAQAFTALTIEASSETEIEMTASAEWAKATGAEIEDV